MKQAFVVPDDKTRLTVRVGDDGVWLTFHAAAGLSWTLNMGAFACNAKGLTQKALEAWCADMLAIAFALAQVDPNAPVTDVALNPAEFDAHG